MGNEQVIANGETKKSFVKESILPYLTDLAVVLSVVLFVFVFIFRISVVDGGSMNNTLIDGDYVLLLNSLIAGSPEKGDIVVVSKAAYSDGRPIIKRVIATEGQQVYIDFDTGDVYVDNVLLEESYISSPTTTFEGVSFPLTVEKGCLFVLGDNRLISKDSRSPEIGQIDCRQVVGKAFLLLFPGVDPATQSRHFDRIGVIG